MRHPLQVLLDTSTQVEAPLPTARILELIDEASRLQVQQINLIGGEIFLHQDWKIILQELVKKGIAPEFISTKIPLTKRIIQDIQETGYQGIVQVSLDAVHPDILTSSLGVNRQYVEQMLNGLRLLDDSGLTYQVSSVLTTYNCDVVTLAEVLSQLSQLKHLHDWRILPATNSISKNYKKFAQLKPLQTEVLETFKEMRPLISNAPFPVILGKASLTKEYYDTWGGSRHFKGSECSALTTHLFILPDGKVTICEQLYWLPQFIIGDVTTQSISEVWNSPQAMHLYSLTRSDISEASRCKSCYFFEDCFSYQNRCWSDIVKAYGTDCWDYPDPRCRCAPEMKNNLGYE